MLTAILQLGASLRGAGLRVSPPELCDAARAAAVAGLAGREDLRRALAAALCKRRRDAATFDSAFDAVFPPAPPGDAALATDDETRMAILQTADLIAAAQAARLSAVARFALTGDDAGLLLELIAAGERAGVSAISDQGQEGFYVSRLLAALAWEGSEAELRGALAALAGRLTKGQAAQLAAAAEHRRRQVRDAARALVRNACRRARPVDAPDPMRMVPLVEKSFYLLTPEDTARLRGVLEELCRKIRARARRRRVRFSHGKVDVQRTVRRSIGTGGVPMDVAFRKRAPRRHGIVVLCDLSDSVRNVSRFMLQFVHTLQGLFGSVRSFVFVNEVGEATSLFKRHRIAEAVERVFAGEVVNVWGNSNYGRVFDAMRADHARALTHDATVIVLGDGRNNYHDPNAGALAAIRRRVRRVVWLTPEPETSWGFGDSEMRLYRAHCDRVETVRNVADLKIFVDGLVL